MAEVVARMQQVDPTPSDSLKNMSDSAAKTNPIVFANCMRALDLRLTGKTYEQIGNEMGVEWFTACFWVKKGLELFETHMAGDVSTLKKMESARLDKMMDALMPWAVESHPVIARDGRIIMVPPDVKYAKTILQIMERRAKMLGLDAPVKQLHGEDPDNPFQHPKEPANLLVVLQNLANRIPEQIHEELDSCDAIDVDSRCLLEEKECDETKSDDDEFIRREFSQNESSVKMRKANPDDYVLPGLYYFNDDVLLLGIAHNDETETLTIQFKTMRVYEFLNVPEDVFFEFKQASDPSDFFDIFIKGRYRTQRVK